MNTEAAGESLRDSILGAVTLAENDLTPLRILSITLALQAEFIASAAQGLPEHADGLELARASTVACQTYLSSLDGQNPA